MEKSIRRWTKEEDDRLLRQITAFPQNLNKCFFIVAEEIDRSPKAVAGHWYQKLSKRPDVMCFFIASQRHIARNRKNGTGMPSNPSIWRRFLRVIKSVLGQSMIYVSDVKPLLQQWRKRLNKSNNDDSYKVALSECIYDLEKSIDTTLSSQITSDNFYS